MPLRLYRRAGTSFWWLSGTIAGRRLRESTGTGDKQLAEEYRAAREAALYRAAVHGAPARLTTFAEAALSYLQHAGPHTDATRARVGRLLTHFGPTLAANDVAQVALDEACLALLRPGASPATRLREIITPARAVLTHAAKRGLCSIPALDVPRAPPARTEWLTPAEVDRLLHAAAPHLRPLLAFLAATGARLGEALALRWEDVDLAHAHALLRDTKSGRDRPVALPPRAVAALAAIPTPTDCRRIGPVFLTQRGAPYADRRRQGGGQIKTAWARAAAVIPKPITPHTLRHTWATWHYAEHRDLLLLKREGGWASVAMVERYAHLAPASIVAAAQRWRGTGTKLAQPAPLIRRKRSRKSTI